MLVPKGRNWRSLGNSEEDEHTPISETAAKKTLTFGLVVFGLVVESIDKPFH